MVNAQPTRSRGVKVLKAVSSPMRLQILNWLFDKSALSYSELMAQLKMNPSRDAGRFAYHLKFLLKAGLVEADVESKKYYLTDLGKMVLDVADRVEKKAVKPKGMLVRTSHLTLEEFDANKIANSLIKEAKVPAELAQKAAKETEKRLVKSKTKYLTASLIREVVNGILVEKGYEDYRHKLTRVGMPVHEVTVLIESRDADLDCSVAISRAGQAVISEYTLLNIFPRDISDAHLSGAIHIDSLGTWLLKPSEVVHELRYFFVHGIQPDVAQQAQMAPPTDFKSALCTAFNVLLHASRETSRSQAFNYFNLSLAPFARGNDVAKLKENLRLFILNLNQHVDAALGLELDVSKSTAEKEAFGPAGKSVGKYGDYAVESRLLASLILDVFLEENAKKPLLNPKLIIRVTPSAFEDEAARVLLLKAHRLAAQGGAPYFANLTKRDAENWAYSSSGVKFSSDLTGDWETDTLRTGCLGCVTINLPRIVLECEGDKNKFLDIFKERFELSARALGIKNNALKQFGKNSLPFLLQKSNGDVYFRLEHCSRIVNLAGFCEAAEAFTGKAISAPETRQFAEEVIAGLLAFRQKLGRKYGKRLYPAILGNREAAERLAQLDIERFGVAKVKFSGTRDKPYYSTLKRLQIKPAPTLLAPVGTVENAQLTKGLLGGGSLDILELEGDGEYSADALLDLTKRIIDNQASEFFSYNRAVSFCGNCKKNYFGTLHKCPSCGSMSNLTAFDRFNST
ncbi:MAG: helix-turn-helix domain-containing protein [Candidatus Bathyarchaeota archaeon]|nr:helix-turn-helix domain-containing protein [Candidatus Bathyarchaeota archaeon]